MLTLYPPFESAREQLFNSLFDCQSSKIEISFIETMNLFVLSSIVVTSQKRIKSSRYQVEKNHFLCLFNKNKINDEF